MIFAKTPIQHRTQWPWFSPVVGANRTRREVFDINTNNILGLADYFVAIFDNQDFHKLFDSKLGTIGRTILDHALFSAITRNGALP